jgi:hypothetical protein
VTSEGHDEARRLTPEGARGSLRLGICGPNCASHRGFGIFEGIVCRDIRHWRMIHAALARSHERVFLRTLLSNFPSICSRQRIADSIASFFVYRYLAFKRRTRRGLNKSSSFARIHSLISHE